MRIKRLMAAFFGVALLTASIAGSASAQQFGLVNVEVGDITILENVNVAVAVPAVVALCPTLESCTSSLRVIPAAQKSRKMSSFHHCMRAFCHGSASFFLPTGLPRTALVVHRGKSGFKRGR
jgi:hypothetical protein